MIDSPFSVLQALEVSVEEWQVPFELNRYVLSPTDAEKVSEGMDWNTSDVTVFDGTVPFWQLPQVDMSDVEQMRHRGVPYSGVEHCKARVPRHV